MSEYYVVSVNHTHRRDPYITVWRPDDCGYAYPLSWAGKYAEGQVLAKLRYYNSGCSAVAVPCSVLDQLAVPPAPMMIDGDAGPVVPNNAATWRAIKANVIMPPSHPIIAEFKGARNTRQEKDA